MSADGKEQEAVTDGLDGSDTRPDWSDHGLLFLRDPGGVPRSDLPGESRHARREPDLGRRDAQSPTWAPGDHPRSGLARAGRRGCGQDALAQGPRRRGSPTPLGTAAYGPPAWGSRCVALPAPPRRLRRPRRRSCRQRHDEGSDQGILLLLVSHDGHALVADRHLQRRRRRRAVRPGRCGPRRPPSRPPALPVPHPRSAPRWPRPASPLEPSGAGPADAWSTRSTSSTSRIWARSALVRSSISAGSASGPLTNSTRMSSLMGHSSARDRDTPRRDA